MELRHHLKASLGAGYAIERELESGGVFRTFLATDRGLERRVVIKVLPPELAGTVSAQRFHQAIQPATRLQHPYIVPLLSSGEAKGHLYYTLPFVPGESLRGRLTRTGELPLEEAIALLREVSAALAHAHEHGVVHRALGPDIVFLAAGEARVADFGVARALSDSAVEEGLGSAWLGLTRGTPAYRAPEPAAGQASADYRADLYALGCLAYEVLSGQAPFPGRSAAALLVAHAAEEPERVERRRSELPAPLANLVTSCLEKRPADRPRSASEVLLQLERFDRMLTLGSGRPAT